VAGSVPQLEKRGGAAEAKGFFARAGDIAIAGTRKTMNDGAAFVIQVVADSLGGSVRIGFSKE